ncbi:R3H domain-containing protein 4 [Benincasa hispida]|uniref:R3H domain-containing protein 4 n=1 Tax=Benincasa hispida TaxID=102211 RepID=UPI0019029489|nr:R3H domain-containing protein 4 [Benincasa hispida]
MASTDVLKREANRFTFSPLNDPLNGDTDSRSMSIEKKIEFLESLTGKVTNRKSRRWLNDRLLMELVPRLNAEEIRGLFAPPPWGDDVRPTTFSMTNAGDWDKFRSIDMDKEAKIIGVFENSSAKRKGHIDADKMAFLNAWHRIECRTREALRRSFLPELIEGFEECIRSFISETGKDVLMLRVQDPFHRLLLHGVCEFYNLDSVTVPESKNGGSIKMTRITRKKKAMVEVPNITLTHFLKMSKEGTW